MSAMMSVTVFLLGFFVCILPSAADVCSDPKKSIKPVDKWDVREEDVAMYFCRQSVQNATVNYCKIAMKKSGEKTSEIESHFYDKKSQEVKTRKYVSEATSKPGINKDILDGPPEVMCYITDVSDDKQCLTYVDCFKGGPWGGSEDSGTFIGLICREPKQCKDAQYQHMVEKINKELLSDGPELEETDQENCKKLGIE